MLVLKIYGIPEYAPENELELLAKNLADAVASVDELKLSPKSVAVFFPADRLPFGLGEELICDITGLLHRPERTRDAKKRLVTMVENVLIEFVAAQLSVCMNIDVSLYAFNPSTDVHENWTRQKTDEEQKAEPENSVERT